MEKLVIPEIKLIENNFRIIDCRSNIIKDIKSYLRSNIKELAVLANAQIRKTIPLTAHRLDANSFQS